MEDPKSFSYLDDYLDAYMTVVREHHECFQKYRGIPYRGPGFLTAETPWDSGPWDDSDEDRPTHPSWDDGSSGD